MILTRWLSLCCIILVLSLLPGCSDPDKKKQKHFSRAIEYIQQEDSNAAILELRNAIQIDPKFADARYQLGLLYLKNGDARAAFGELQRTANLDPTNLDAGVKVAEFYLLAKNPKESRTYVTKVLEADPGYVDALALLANLELVDGNFEAASKAIDQVKAESIESDRFYNIKGRIFASQKKIEEAEEQFLKALDLGPDNFTNYRTLLLFYQQLNRNEDAEKILESAVTRFPENAQVYLLLANFHRANKDLDKAYAAARKAIDIEPENEAFRLMAADILKTDKKAKEAEAFLLEGLKTLPDSLEIKSTLADLEFDLQKFPEAQKLIEEILASNPTHGGATFVKAKLLLKDNKLREAADMLTSLTTNYPKWADPFYFLALTNLRLGEIELAQKNGRAALQLAPADSRYHTLQSQILLIQGDTQNAGKEASLALRLDNSNFAAAKLLAKSLLQDKRFDDAIKVIEEIRSKVPTDIEMLGSLGLAQLGKKDQEQAAQSFARLLELAPDNSKALALFTSLNAKGDINSAIGIVKEQITKAPEAAGHYMLLGDLLLKSKKTDEALETFAKAQELAPQNPQPYIIRARVMHATGKTEEAVNEFQELIKTQPDSIPANLGLATLYEAQKKFTEAKTQYQKVLTLKPDQPAAANNLAYLTALDENGDLGEALRLAMLAKQALPEDPRIADTLGFVHLKREAYGLAITQFQQAHDALPEDPVVNYHLALAQFSDNQKESALASIQKSLSSKTPFDEREEAEKLLQQIQNM
jgi:tetratricopeptide (TPR) repeat protein